MEGRPYKSIDDFLSKVKITKPQMINLIKAGAFDAFGDRIDVMEEYVASISDCKKRVTLQNMKMLIDFDLIPDEYDMVRRVFNYNKYLKKQKLDDTYFGMDSIAFDFYEKNFDMDLLEAAETESGFKIKQTVWKKIYDSWMDKIRPFIKENAGELLDKMNEKLMSDVWDKYCKGSVSKWEMDAISCYVHPHELALINPDNYGWDEFGALGSTPEIERFVPIKGKMVPIYKLHKIVGTVLDRDKAKKTVTLLTTDGVVNVKIYGVFQNYDRQISEKGPDGKKHVLEKSMFSRGNIITVQGIREEDGFRAKKYSKTPGHLIEQVIIEDDGNIRLYSRTESEEK